MEYAHLVKVGTGKLLTWFGKDMFESLHICCQLPSHLMPCDLLDYLTEVYAQKEDHQRHVDKVVVMVDTVYNPTKPVETYFATLQNAKDHAILLGILYSEKQLMYHAMNQFKTQLTREHAGNIERNWLEMPAENCTWAAFKMFWIKAILRRKYLGTDTHAANHAALEQNSNDLASAMETVASIRHKN
mmetsp:Transcript_8618/g.18781  ORF Transcript_8618/g.18781 Transcript_8618/m.18781 type:complete len:187 (-) Transcript_8618:407-967(-)